MRQEAFRDWNVFFVPTVLRIRGYRFYFYAREGSEPAHVHIEKGGGALKVWLGDVTIAKTEGLKPAEIREALKLTNEHRPLLVQAWHEFKRRKS